MAYSLYYYQLLSASTCVTGPSDVRRTLEGTAGRDGRFNDWNLKKFDSRKNRSDKEQLDRGLGGQGLHQDQEEQGQPVRSGHPGQHPSGLIKNLNKRRNVFLNYSYFLFCFEGFPFS